MGQEFLTGLGETVCVFLAFWIFFALMRKFAWGPILDQLDERRNRIQAGFDDIRKAQAEAAEARKGYEARLSAIEAEAREKIAAAIKDGERVAAEISAKAREDAAEFIESSRKRVELEMAGLRKQLREEVVTLTLAATEKLLVLKLDAGKDKELVGSFVSELERKSL